MRKNILLGVCGSIAAYKSAELVSRLREQDFDVKVLMTQAAQQFITPLTLATLSQNSVGTDLWKDDPQGTEHIELARWADLFLIAPLSANTASDLRMGRAHDWITTVALATRAPLVLAPAMNTVMWEHPAVRENLTILESRGAQIIAPTSGILACGEIGTGKLAAVADIVEAIRKRTLTDQTPFFDYKDQTLLVTSGPTRSFIDSVRYMTNPSTGKMGASLAEAALQRGARVIYVSGTDKGVILPKLPHGTEPSQLKVISVETAEEMFEAAAEHLSEATGIIATAAVLDYRFKVTASQKIKRSTDESTVELVPSIDVLAGLRARGSANQWFVGFAAETNDWEFHARKKLERKKLHAVFVNPVALHARESLPTGFGSSTNQGHWVTPQKTPVPSPLLAKEKLGHWILDQIKKDILST